MVIKNLVKRNLRIFFRDKTAVFFSLLSVFIVIGLYILFLGDMMSNNYPNTPGVRFLMDSWIMAGLLGVTTVTTTMGALGIIVQDKITKVIKDFKVAPIKRSTLISSYILSSFMIGLILTLITLLLAQIYIVLYGGEFLNILSLLKVIGIIVVSLFASSSIVFLLVTFLNTSSAFGTASSVVGTMIGFLAGVYIPIGVLPSSVQTIVKIFPPFHSTVLLRQVMMDKPILSSFSGQNMEMILNFKYELGVITKIGSFEITPIISFVFLIVTGFLFYFIGTMRLMKKDN